jgi:hypothetical protein
MGGNRRRALVREALLLITTILHFCLFAGANKNVFQDIEDNHYVDSTQSLVVQDNYYNRMSRNLEEYYFLQLGQEILGEEADPSIIGDESPLAGSSVSINSDGSIVVIGSPGFAFCRGSVYVYQYNNITLSWDQLGDDLWGASQSDFGTSVSISADGTRVAVGSRSALSAKGQIQVFETPYYSSSQIGSTLVGLATDSYFGKSVALNQDGSILAGGAFFYDGGKGYVSIYELIGDEWSQLGASIFGVRLSYFGTSIALNQSGNRIIIGADVDGENSSYLGSAHVYEWSSSSSSWAQLGQTLTGSAAYDYFGKNVDMSNDGGRIVVSATGHDNYMLPDNELNLGQVFIFDYNNALDTWTEVGSVYGEFSDDQSGEGLSISGDGNRIAIGAAMNDGGGNNAGHVRIFDYHSDIDAWEQTAWDLDDRENESRFGSAVALSGDGIRFAVGAPKKRYELGSARMYEIRYGIPPTSAPSVSPSPTESPSNIPSIVPTEIPTKKPSNIPSQQPSTHPSVFPTSAPSENPTAYPSFSFSPSFEPTFIPSLLPSEIPTRVPSFIPTFSPSDQPSFEPSVLPTSGPSSQPSIIPSFAPSVTPSSVPSVFPSGSPSDEPSLNPSIEPSRTPTVTPSLLPSNVPSMIPSRNPSVSPSTVPTTVPTNIPSLRPSISHGPSEEYLPSAKPSVSSKPSTRPSGQPSNVPTQRPSERPTDLPSDLPSIIPTFSPSDQPSVEPSFIPRLLPSEIPTIASSLTPTNFPSVLPSFIPSSDPSSIPSSPPSILPSFLPSINPTSKPTGNPSASMKPSPAFFPSTNPSDSFFPSSRPSHHPITVPTSQPSNIPSLLPSVVPSRIPSQGPSRIPTFGASEYPSLNPSDLPSVEPSNVPTKQPSASPSFSSSSIPTVSFGPSSLYKPSESPSWSFLPTSFPSDYPSSNPSELLTFVTTQSPSISPSLLSSEMPSEDPTRILTVPSKTPSFQPSHLVDTTVTFDIEFSVSCPFDENQISALASSLEHVLSSVISIDDVHTEVTVTIFNGNECFSRRNRRALSSFRTIKAEAEVHLSTFDPFIVLPISSDALTMIKTEESFIYDEILIQSGISIANMTISIIENPSEGPTNIPTVEPTLEPSTMPSQKPSESLRPSTSPVLFSMPSELPSSSKPSQGPTVPVIEIHHAEVTYILGFKYNPPEPIYNAATLKDLNVYGDVMNTVKLTLSDFLSPSSNHTNVEGYRQMLEIYDTYSINDDMNSINHKRIIDVLACPIEFDTSDSCVKVVTDIGIEINVIKIEANEVITALKSFLRNAMKSPDFVQMLNETDIVQVQYEDNVHIDGKDGPSTSMISIIASSCVVGIVAIIFGIRRYNSYCFHESNNVYCKNNCNIKSADFCADDEKLGPRSTYYERQTAPPMNEVYPSSRPVSAITNITSAVSRISHSVSPIITELKSKKRSLEMRFSSIFGGSNAPQETSTRATNPSVRTRRRSRQRRTPQTDQSSMKS